MANGNGKERRIRVVHPDGRTGTIPESQLDQAVAAGFRRTLSPQKQKPSIPSDFLRTLKEDIFDPAIQLGGVATGLREPQTGFGKAAKRGLLPSPFGRNLDAALAELVGGTIGAQRAQLGQAGELAGRVFEEGQPTRERVLNAIEAAGRTGAGLVPAIGPFLAETGEAIGEKRPGKVAAKGLELLFGFARTRAGLKPLKGIPKRVAGKIGRALRPRQTAKVALQESLPISLEELKFHLRKTGKRPPESLQDLQQITSEARQIIGKEIEAKLGTSKTTILGNDLIEATKKGISKPSRLLDDRTVAGLEKTIERQLRGKEFTLVEAESLRQQLNAELSTFFEQRKIKQRKAAVTEVPIQARLALREALEQRINNILGDTELSAVRKRYGALRRLEDATTDRIVKELFNDPSLGEQLLALESLDTLAAGSAVAFATAGQLELALGSLTTVAARRVLVTISRKLKDPNLKVRQAFSQLDKPRKANISGPLFFLLVGQEDKPLRRLTRIPSTIP